MVGCLKLSELESVLTHRLEAVYVESKSALLRENHDIARSKKRIGNCWDSKDYYYPLSGTFIVGEERKTVISPAFSKERSVLM